MADKKQQPAYDVVFIRFPRGHPGFTRWLKLCQAKGRDGSNLGKELIEKACNEAQIPAI